MCLLPGNPGLCGPLPGSFQAYFTHQDLTCSGAPGLPYSPCTRACMRSVMACQAACLGIVLLASFCSSSCTRHGKLACDVGPRAIQEAASCHGGLFGYRHVHAL